MNPVGDKIDGPTWRLVYENCLAVQLRRADIFDDEGMTPMGGGDLQSVSTLGAAAVGGGPPILLWRAWWGALGVVGLALLLGWVLLPRLRRLGWRDAWLLRAVAGLVPTGLVILIFGQFHGALFAFPWSIPALGGWTLFAGSGFSRLRKPKTRAGTIDPARREPRGRTTPQPAPRARRLDRLASIAGWCVVLFWFLMILPPAFCPPAGYDVLEYHLGVVPHIFEAGRVEPIPGVFYSAQPIGTELLYALASIIERDAWGNAPGVLQWLLIVLGAMVMLRLARRLAIPAPWRPWLLAVLLTHPLVFRFELDRLTDWTGLLMLAAGLWVWRMPCVFTRDAREALRSRLPQAALMGLFAGGALGAKWTHAGTVVLPLAMLAFSLGFRRQSAPAPHGTAFRRAMLLGLLCLAACILTWLPWGIWLWRMRGNPFAPFLAGFFPTEAWPPARLDFLLATHGPLSPSALEYWKNLALRLGVGFDGIPLIGLALVGVALWLVASGAIKPFAQRARSSVRAARWTPILLWLTAPLVLSCLLWGQLRHAADRFLTPPLLTGLLILALLPALSLKVLAAKSPARRAIVAFGIGLAMFAAIWQIRENLPILRWGDFASRALGRVSCFDHERHLLGATADLFQAVNHLPPAARLIAVNEARRYPFRRPVSLATVFDRSPIRPAVTGADNGQTILQRLREAGYTHLLVNEFEQARLLRMHTPPALIGDPRFESVLNSGDDARLVREYWGYAEFAVDPLTSGERRGYQEFLDRMRARASWISAPKPAGAPAMWIVPLD